MPARMVSPLDPSRPLCQYCQPGTRPSPTLASIARPPAPPRKRQCSVCLAPETFRMSGQWAISSLKKNGTCKNRAACEKRQPPLIPLEDL
jgi:hypothetical protein